MAEILIVDDSPSIRIVLRRQLEAAGYQVHEAEDGEVALAMLNEAEQPLVVLLDVVMPRLGGIGLLTAVDSSPKLAGRHVFVLVTSHALTQPLPAVAEMLERMAVPTLLKPVAADHLIEAVAEAEQRLAQSQSSITTRN